MHIRHPAIVERLYGLLGDYHSFFFHSLVRRPEPNEYKTFSQDDKRIDCTFVVLLLYFVVKIEIVTSN